MTQEEKSLLLQDLCARLPYGVKVYNTTFKEPTTQTLYGKISSDEFLMEETYTSVGVDGDDFGFSNKRHYTGYIDFIKPYLRHMSSMTEEEKEEAKTNGCIIYHDTSPKNRGLMVIASPKGFDWLNKKMFAYRTIDGKDMFELGLAIEAPEGMYNTK